MNSCSGFVDMESQNQFSIQERYISEKTAEPIWQDQSRWETFFLFVASQCTWGSKVIRVFSSFELSVKNKRSKSQGSWPKMANRSIPYHKHHTHYKSESLLGSFFTQWSSCFRGLLSCLLWPSCFCWRCAAHSDRHLAITTGSAQLKTTVWI